MPLDLLIRNATVVRASGVEQLSIGIADGKIAALAEEISGPAREEIDAANLHLFPGLIDSHVHFNDAGATGEAERGDWEGVGTGSSALAAAGGTTFFDMPLNSLPPTLTPEAFDQKLAACKKNARADFALWGGLTPTNLDQLEPLANRGVIGFKAFMSNSGVPEFQACDDLTLYRGMQIAAKLKLPVAVHAESESLTAALSQEAKSAGKTTIDAYIASRPIVAELDAIRRAILFARETRCALHIVHVSSPAGILEVTAHKLTVNVTTETCPHYLLLSEDDMRIQGPPAKCAPPLRPREQVEKLRAQLAAGHIDTIASDHSPAPASLKQSQNFFQVWGGIAGIQTTLRALLTLNLPLPLIAKLTSETPATRFRLPQKGGIQIGKDADLTLVDLSSNELLSRGELLDRHKNSPYINRRLKGKITRTILRGKTTFHDGAILAGPVGQFLKPVKPE
jgi:allantoinase